MASAPTVVCSYAAQLDGSRARPSPLLGSFAGGIAVPAFAPPLPQPPCATLRFDEPARIAPWPAERVAGGSEVLKKQAACGFQSFARRLGADPLEDEAWGLDSAGRATLLHRALQELWSTEPIAEPGEYAEFTEKLHTRDDLARAIGDGSIDELLQAAVARTFEQVVREASGDDWRLRYLQLEQQRLCIRIEAWLLIEQDRADFAVIAVERSLEARIAGLRLNLRADRVDEVAEGRRLILDYKTADQVSTRLWDGERPDEPQLPIYALFGGIENVAGLVFAQIRAAKTTLTGLSTHPVEQLGPAPGKPPKPGSPAKPDKRRLPPETLDAWDAALCALATQYLQGDAPVNPKKRDETCKFCGLQGVCRVRSQPGAFASLAEESNHV